MSPSPSRSAKSKPAPKTSGGARKAAPKAQPSPAKKVARASGSSRTAPAKKTSSKAASGARSGAAPATKKKKKPVRSAAAVKSGRSARPAARKPATAGAPAGAFPAPAVAPRIEPVVEATPAMAAPVASVPGPASLPAPVVAEAPRRETNTDQGRAAGAGRGEGGSGPGGERRASGAPPRAGAPGSPPAGAGPRSEPEQPPPSARSIQPAPAPAPARADHHHTPAGPTHPGRDEIFERGVRFADLGLRESVLRGVTEAGFEYPTAIQARIIPVILSGRDVLGQAKTGTGKTAAFGLPLLNKIDKGGGAFQAMVLVPTRELAIQVATDLRELGRFTGLNILPVYGGQNVKTQANLLSRGPEIIVATPGRVMDMQQRGYLNYRNIKAVVLDEVDRMLDIGFRDDIRRILGGCPRERQTVFVSATINSDIEALARSYARECEKIVASAGSLTVSMVKQFHLPVQPWDKKQLLLHLLTHEEPALTVVFCRTKKTVDDVAEYLARKGVDCHAIHGDMYQNKRNKVIERLKAGKLEVLVASDVASRGLDVEGITHVINYDLPEDPDLYVHRIGRTARAGRDGVAWSLVTPEQGALLTQIELLINAEVPKLDYPDFKPGPVPPDVLARQQQEQRRIEAARQFNRFSSIPAPGAAAPSPGAPAGASGAAPGAGQRAAAALPAPAPDPNRFPGGIVPTMAPPKRMFGKVKTARSMRQGMPPPPPPVNAPQAS